MLRTDLPKIITETLPGPKAQAIIDRRADVIPDAIRCIYPVVIAKGEGAMLEDAPREDALRGSGRQGPRRLHGDARLRKRSARRGVS